MTLFEAIILGIIEGLTEFLPVSSTAHILLMATLLDVPNDDFFKSFTYIIQGGTILSLVLVFAKQLIAKPILLIKLFVAFLPTAIIGLIFKQTLFEQLLDNNYLTIITLIIVGLFMLFWDKLTILNQNKYQDIATVPYKYLFIIGMVQSIAIIPGVSRSASSIFAGLVCGMDKPTAIKWSFLLALPTLLGATTVAINELDFSSLSSNFEILLISTMTAMLTGIIILVLFQRLAQRTAWRYYGLYRVAFAICTYLLIIN